MLTVLADRHVDDLIPFPRLREDSSLTIHPCSSVSSGSGNKSIRENGPEKGDISPPPLEWVAPTHHKQEKSSEEVPLQHVAANDHDTASDLSEDDGDNVGEACFYDIYELGEVVSNC